MAPHESHEAPAGSSAPGREPATEELIPAARAAGELPTPHPSAAHPPEGPDREAAPALRELGAALVAVRDAVRGSADSVGADAAAPELAALPAFAHLADAVDRLGAAPDALARALRGSGPSVPLHAEGFGVPGLVDFRSDEDGWSVSSPVANVSGKDGQVSISTPVGEASFGSDGGRVETPVGSVDVDRSGVTVTTPWGSTRVGKDGKVVIEDADGNPVSVPLPGSAPGTNPFELPIPIPTFKVQPFEIPIPVPKFESDPFRIGVPVPEFGAQPFPIPLPVPGFAPFSFGGSADSGSSPFALPPWLAWLSGFPDVARTPTPAGPVPIPYPNFGDPGPWSALAKLPAAAQQILAAVSGVALQLADAVAKLPDAVPHFGPPAPWVAECRRAVARAVARWMPGVHAQGGKIMAVSCILVPGEWRSDRSLRTTLREELLLEGLSTELAEPVSKVLGGRVDDWLSSAMTPGLPLYPAFAAFPAPQAPPMPNIPMPVGIVCASPRVQDLMAPELEAALLSELEGAAEPEAFELSARQLAAWFSERFTLWSMTTQVTLLMGHGPVPGFAPPSIPVGPVIGGSVLPTRGILVGGNVFAAAAPGS